MSSQSSSSLLIAPAQSYSRDDQNQQSPSSLSHLTARSALQLLSAFLHSSFSSWNSTVSLEIDLEAEGRPGQNGIEMDSTTTRRILTKRNPPTSSPSSRVTKRASTSSAHLHPLLPPLLQRPHLQFAPIPALPDCIPTQPGHLIILLPFHFFSLPPFMTASTAVPKSTIGAESGKVVPRRGIEVSLGSEQSDGGREQGGLFALVEEQRRSVCARLGYRPSLFTPTFLLPHFAILSDCSSSFYSCHTRQFGVICRCPCSSESAERKKAERSRGDERARARAHTWNWFIR